MVLPSRIDGGGGAGGVVVVAWVGDGGGVGGGDGFVTVLHERHFPIMRNIDEKTVQRFFILMWSSFFLSRHHNTGRNLYF